MDGVLSGPSRSGRLGREASSHLLRPAGHDVHGLLIGQVLKQAVGRHDDKGVMRLQRADCDGGLRGEQRRVEGLRHTEARGEGVTIVIEGLEVHVAKGTADLQRSTVHQIRKKGRGELRGNPDKGRAWDVR